MTPASYRRRRSDDLITEALRLAREPYGYVGKAKLMRDAFLALYEQVQKDDRLETPRLPMEAAAGTGASGPDARGDYELSPEQVPK